MTEEEFKREAEERLATQAPDLNEWIVSVALHAADLEWAVDLSLRAWARAEDESARGNAVLAFGHLARRFGELPRIEEIVPVVQAAWEDDSFYVSGHAHSAASDISQFLADVAIILPPRP